jgi:hypothetical protein
VLGDGFSLRRNLAFAQQGPGATGAQRQDCLVHHHQANRGGQSDRLGQPSVGGTRVIARPRRMLPGQDNRGTNRPRTG